MYDIEVGQIWKSDYRVCRITSVDNFRVYWINLKTKQSSSNKHTHMYIKDFLSQFQPATKLEQVLYEV